MRFIRFNRNSFVNGALVLLLLAICPLLLADSRVLLIKSSDNTYFNKTIENLINQAEPGVDFSITTLDETMPEKATGDFDQVVTLGARAVDHALDRYAQSLVVHSYLTEHEFRQLELPARHFALLLDQPLDLYLRLTQQLLPGSKIGMIRDPADWIEPQRLEQSEQQLGIQLEQIMRRDNENPVNLVRQVLAHSDALLALPEPDIFNRTTLRGILLAAYRLNKPLVSYSPAHVKAGALAAVFTTPQQIGAQLADLLQELTRGRSNEEPRFRYANQFNIAINRQVARSLNIDIDSDDKVLRRLRTGDSS
jgi:hypothetical protein